MNSRDLFGMVVCTILVWATSFAVARGQNDPEVDGSLPADMDASPPSISEMMADPPRWTASADFILLDRSGGGNQTLVARVPADEDPFTIPGTEALDSSDFQQGFRGGPRLDLIRHDDSGYDLELSYFQVDGWSSARTIGPDVPADWLVMTAPGGFVQIQDKAYQAMAWEYATKLYSAESNVRWNPSDRVTLLAGFRWVGLRENLVGALEPSTFDREAPFWNTTTRNDLYGFQIGGDGKIWDRGRFSIDGLAKAGIFDDNAEESTGVSIYKVVRPSSASTNHAAFVGETGLQCKFRLTENISLKAGYEVMWLEGVASAPGQIQETVAPKSAIVQALGVDCNAGVFYHGASVGLEYSF